MQRYFFLFLVIGSSFFSFIEHSARAADEPNGKRAPKILTPDEIQRIREQERALAAKQGLPRKGVPMKPSAGTATSPTGLTPTSLVSNVSSVGGATGATMSAGKKATDHPPTTEGIAVPPVPNPPQPHRSFLDSASTQIKCKEMLENEIKIMGIYAQAENTECLGKKVIKEGGLEFFRGPASVTYQFDTKTNQIILTSKTKNAVGNSDIKQLFIQEKDCKIDRAVMNQGKGKNWAFVANLNTCVRLNYMKRQSSSSSLVHRVSSESYTSLDLQNRGYRTAITDITPYNEADYMALCEQHLQQFTGFVLPPPGKEASRAHGLTPIKAAN